MLCRSVIQEEKERIHSEHRETATSLNNELIKLLEEKKVAVSRLSEAEYHTRLLLEEQKDYLLSEARSELDMQELRVESADRALQEPGLWLHFQRMDLYLLSDHSKREELAMHWIGQNRKTPSRRSYEESSGDRRIEKMWCTEEIIEKRRYSIQEKESQSTVNQFVVQIQELRDMVNPLNDSRDSWNCK